MHTACDCENLAASIVVTIESGTDSITPSFSSTSLYGRRQKANLKTIPSVYWLAIFYA